MLKVVFIRFSIIVIVSHKVHHLNPSLFQFSKEDDEHHVRTAAANVHMQSVLSTWSLVQELSNGNHARFADASFGRRKPIAARVCHPLLFRSNIYKLSFILRLRSYWCLQFGYVQCLLNAWLVSVNFLVGAAHFSVFFLIVMFYPVIYCDV